MTINAVRTNNLNNPGRPYLKTIPVPGSTERYEMNADKIIVENGPIETDSREINKLRTQLQMMRANVQYLDTLLRHTVEQRLLSAPIFNTVSCRDFIAKSNGNVNIITTPDQEAPSSEKRNTNLRHGKADLQCEVSIPVNFEPVKKDSRVIESENVSLKDKIVEKNVAILSTSLTPATEMEKLSAKLISLESENESLRIAFGKANERANAIMQNNQEDQESDENPNDELGIDNIGRQISSDFERDLHERCDHKIHESWQTIKTLQTYVETFRVEIEDLKQQRDDAIASAERAWEENIKLAGNSNPQQKIKYLEAVKKENTELRKKVREMQSNLAKLQVTGMKQQIDSHISDSGGDDGSEEERSKLIKKMWARNKVLEEKVDQLTKEKKQLAAKMNTTRVVPTRQSRPQPLESKIPKVSKSTITSTKRPTK